MRSVSSGVAQEAARSRIAPRTKQSNEIPNARSRYQQNRKNFSAVSVVASAISCKDTPRAFAIDSATRRVCHGSHRFPRKRNRREIWTIGFHHEISKRQFGRNFTHARAVLESDDSGKGNEMTERDHFLRLFARPAEAMEDAAKFSGIRPHDCERIVPCIALMNHDVQPEFNREIELLLETNSPVSICKHRRECRLRFLLRSRFATPSRIPASCAPSTIPHSAIDDNRDRFHRSRPRAGFSPVRAAESITSSSASSA